MNQIKILQPHPTQQIILDHPARNKVIVCGRRFGKTILALAKMFEEGLSIPDSSFFYIAPFLNQAKQISWDLILKAYNNLPDDLKVKKDESALYVKFRDIKQQGISSIYVKGADYPESLKGSGLSGAVLDEYAKMKKIVLDEVVRPSLLDKKGWLLIIGTPQGYNHFYDLYNFALKEENKEDWAVFKYTTYDNPYIDKQEIDKLKKEMSEDFFAQEIMAEFKKFTGLIYKDFDRAIHLIDPIDISNMYKYRAIDCGAVHPFACLWIAVDGDDNWYIYREHNKAGQTMRYHAEFINNNSLGEQYIATYIDPSAKQAALDLGEYGIYTIPAINTVNPNDIEAGIMKIQEKLKKNPVTGKPKLFVFKHCENLIKEFEMYHWDEKKDQTMKPHPIKEMDDSLDSLRYFSNTYQPSRKKAPFEDYMEHTRQNNSNKFTGW